MVKMCIFSSNKICDDCGECERCDLDSTKSCTNCGKCLELPEKEYKKVIIDEIDEEGEYEDSENIDMDDLESTGETDFEEDDAATDYIDDIGGLNELLDTPDNSLLEEVYPGFFTYKKKEKGMH